MCGIAGIISSAPGVVTSARLQLMNDALRHRGPDGESTEIIQGSELTIGFAHRRLAIIDLSEKANQPMHYLERYVLVHNGEIYNYKEIREQLVKQGLRFKSDSDTEVIAAAYHQYGIKCLDFFDGMFAFAIWDKEPKQLFCARDRFGEKPFYYHVNKETHSLFFASEMKGLWAAGIPKEIDELILFQYLTTGLARIHQQPERSFYKHIFQIPPAHYLLWDDQSSAAELTMYWDLDKETQVQVTESEAIDKVNDLLEMSVQRRLRSDVPLGTSLSGGIDSSIIAALCAAAEGSRYTHQSFSAVFPGFEKDETSFIQQVVSLFGLDSKTTEPTARDLAESMEKMMYFQEEPVGSSSAFAQFSVFRLAMDHQVKVLLDGQGADEVFAGYERYSKWFLQSRLRKEGKSAVAKELAQLRANGFLNKWNFRNELAARLPAYTTWMLERQVVRKQQAHPELNPEFREAAYKRELIRKPYVEQLNDILYFDTMQGGLQELLHYADRNSMAWGREIRLPYLNHELVQYIFSLPPGFKIRNGYNKWLLRESYRNRLPENILWRKGKTGFETPQEAWMSNELVQQKIKEAKSLLVEKKLLLPKALNREIKPKPAYDDDNADWRYWVAGILYSQQV